MIANVTISGTYGVPGTQGAGAAGTTLMPVRPDIIAIDSVSGLTGFAFKDANGLRPLGTSATEFVTTTSTLVTNANASATNAFNVKLSATSAAQAIYNNAVAGTLTLDTGAALTNGFSGIFSGAGLQTLNVSGARRARFG